MSDKKIRTMVLAAVLAALACVATMVVQIPSPMNGYVNLGDCFVLLSGWLLGPWWVRGAFSPPVPHLLEFRRRGRAKSGRQGWHR